MLAIILMVMALIILGILLCMFLISIYNRNWEEQCKAETEAYLDKDLAN